MYLQNPWKRSYSRTPEHSRDETEFPSSNQKLNRDYISCQLFICSRLLYFQIKINKRYCKISTTQKYITLLCTLVILSGLLVKDRSMSCNSLLLFVSKPSEVSDHPVREVSTESFCSLADRHMEMNSPVQQRSPVVSASEWELCCPPPRPFSYLSVAHLNFLLPLSTAHLLLNLPGTKNLTLYPKVITAKTD